MSGRHGNSADPPGKAMSAYCHRRLTEILRHKGLSVRLLEDHLQRRPGFWKFLRRRRQGLPLEMFVAACRAEGVHPAHLLAEALGQAANDQAANDNVGEQDFLVASCPASKDPPAWVKACGDYPQLACSAPDVTGGELVTRLDLLRFKDPLAAIAEVETLALAGVLPEACLPAALAAGASAYRMLGQVQAASACLDQGYRLANSREQLALLHQRHAYLLRPLQPQAAEVFTRKAQGIYAALGDVGALGETLVELGEALCALGRFEAGLEAFQDALITYRGKLSRQALVSALQGTANCHLRRSRLVEGRGWLQRAWEEAAPLPEYFRAHLRWSLATLDLDPEGFLGAASDLLPGHPQDAAVCGLDGVVVACRRGLYEQAQELARALRGALTDGRLSLTFKRLMDQAAAHRPPAGRCLRSIQLSSRATAQSPLRPASDRSGGGR